MIRPPPKKKKQKKPAPPTQPPREPIVTHTGRVSKEPRRLITEM